MSEKGVGYNEIVCPNCNHNEFEYIDESNFIDSPSVVYFRCGNCNCDFSALRNTLYSKISVIKREKEIRFCEDCGKVIDEGRKCDLCYEESHIAGEEESQTNK